MHLKLECVLSMNDSELRIQDKRAENVYSLFVSFYIVNKYHTKSAIFTLKISMVTNMILILYNCSINNSLISRDLRFRHHIGCSFSISPAKIIPNSHSTVLCL